VYFFPILLLFAIFCSFLRLVVLALLLPHQVTSGSRSAWFQKLPPFLLSAIPFPLVLSTALWLESPCPLLLTSTASVHPPHPGPTPGSPLAPNVFCFYVVRFFHYLATLPRFPFDVHCLLWFTVFRSVPIFSTCFFLKPFDTPPRYLIPICRCNFHVGRMGSHTS